MENISHVQKTLFITIGLGAIVALLALIIGLYRNYLPSRALPANLSNDRKVRVEGVFSSDTLSVGPHQWGFEATLSDGTVVTASRDFEIIDPYGGNNDPYGSNDDPYGGNNDPYGSNDDPYGGNNDPYGGNPPRQPYTPSRR